MKKITVSFALIFGLMICSMHAHAITLYIGDSDGFGYGNAQGFVGADGRPAQRAGNPQILDPGDALPDRNRDGFVYVFRGDDFDYRDGNEKNNIGNSGVIWTDVSLSRSNPTSPGTGPYRADQAEFTFRFTVPVAGDPDFEQDHFVSLVYADYDVDPMYAEVEGRRVEMKDNQFGGFDGFIWRAYTVVPWSNLRDGRVVVKIIATKEPFVAFDYVFLGSKEISIVNTSLSWLMLLLGE